MELKLERIEQKVGAQTHLYPLDLTLVPRAVTVLLGASQAGKTTLMRVMAGLDVPFKGRVLADGRDVTGLPVRERNVAMVYQQFINYPSMTVADNIASPLKLRREKMSSANIGARVNELAAIEHGGVAAQQQRLGGLGGGVDDGRSAARKELRELVAQLFAQLVVQVHERLVEQHQRCVLRECAGECDALLLTT